MARLSNLSLLLARRQKRLVYWRSRFTADNLAIKELPAEHAAHFRSLFETYSLLMTKMTKEVDEQELTDCELRLESIERELTSLFEERRLMTSDLGSAVTPEPAPGDAGH